MTLSLLSCGQRTEEKGGLIISGALNPSSRHSMVVRAAGVEPANHGTPVITRRQHRLGKRASLATTASSRSVHPQPCAFADYPLASSAYPDLVLGHVCRCATPA